MNDRIYSSAAPKKNINARSRKTRVRIFQPQCYGVRCCVAHRLGRSRFHSTKRKVRHHVTWCLAKTSYQTSRRDVAVTTRHCSRTVLPLTPPETQKLVSWKPSVHCFIHQIARIWTRLTCHLGWSLAKSNFLLSWQNEESDCQKHGRNYRRAQSLPIHHFYQILLTVNVIRQMAPLFFKIDSNKLWRDVQNEESVICVKFGKDLFNISKVIGRKKVAPVFGLHCI